MWHLHGCVYNWVGVEDIVKAMPVCVGGSMMVYAEAVQLGGSIGPCIMESLPGGALIRY